MTDDGACRSCCNYSFAPLGLPVHSTLSRGLRRGLHSFAASRLRAHCAPDSGIPGLEKRGCYETRSSHRDLDHLPHLSQRCKRWAKMARPCGAEILRLLFHLSQLRVSFVRASKRETWGHPANRGAPVRPWGRPRAPYIGRFVKISFRSRLLCSTATTCMGTVSGR